MTQEQNAQKPGKDRYAERGKTLASSVQRLRGWVGSDPSRAPELADSLVLLTSHQLLGHAYAAAAADAQEALRRAAELLTPMVRSGLTRRSLTRLATSPPLCIWPSSRRA